MCMVSKYNQQTKTKYERKEHLNVIRINDNLQIKQWFNKIKQPQQQQQLINKNLFIGQGFKEL